MVPVPLSRLQPSRDEAIEHWPWLDQDVLRSSRNRQVCVTCHFFLHHSGPNCIPLLICQLHQGLIAHNDGRQVLHFRPSRWDRWSQQLEVTEGELLPDQPVPQL